MKRYVSIFLKGFGMGAANVIPGVSGGTIALITGIYNELITTLKSFNLKSFKLLIRLEFKKLFIQLNLVFLFTLFTGAVVGIFSLGKLFKWIIDLDRNVNGKYIEHGYEPVLFALFFGLILSSVYFVGVKIKNWNLGSIFSSLIGCSLAILLVSVKPGSENDQSLFLFFCGIIAMSSMLLPGLSGSFVLILLGNYYLIMIESVQNFDIYVLSIVGLGAIVGFLILSNLISYLLNNYESLTLSSLTGFIFGSLATIWPWKTIVREEIIKGNEIKEVIIGYENWTYPTFNSFDMLLIVFILIGFFMVFGFEKFGSYLKSEN